MELSPNRSLPPAEQKREFVRTIFNRIAPRYDLLNRIMTLGLRYPAKALARCDRESPFNTLPVLRPQQFEKMGVPQFTGILAVKFAKPNWPERSLTHSCLPDKFSQ